ncbi:MAG: Sapep family Mn(2+)-dependent dipeptidase [Eubacteriales bacterium]|nr:Sapep family Mn(2+)-dependent dipeptidase [Eubacteriales bacterium]MDD3349384.1 Sapep family Mn(2+)-dependent dipeptidase [Eubacteriales bacterium]
MDEIYEKLIHLIDGYKEEMIESLSALIKIPSITDQRSEVKKALDYVLENAKREGFHATSLLEGEVGLIEMGQGEEVLGILAHLDVVNEGEIDRWNTLPFEATIKNGLLYGRGAVDDKGPVIAALYAMKAVQTLGLQEQKPFRKKVQLILGTREESEWKDMNSYVAEFPLPDYGFTPDGEFPVCNIEKGVASISMTLPIGVNEVISKLEAGSAHNVVPGKCEAIVNGNRHVANGKAVHACQPEKGENAILKMAAELAQMGIRENPLSKVLDMLLQYFTDREGSALGLRSESEYYNGEFVHRNIFTPTMIKTEKDATTIVFDIRYVYGTEFGEILTSFEKLAASFGGVISSFENLPPVYVSKEKPFIQAFARAYEKMSGRKNEYALAYGGSYAKAMPNVISWGPLFPGEEDTCHEENEFISIEALLLNCRIFAAAIWEIGMSENSFK